MGGIRNGQEKAAGRGGRSRVGAKHVHMRRVILTSCWSFNEMQLAIQSLSFTSSLMHHSTLSISFRLARALAPARCRRCTRQNTRWGRGLLLMLLVWMGMREVRTVVGGTGKKL